MKVMTDRFTLITCGVFLIQWSAFLIVRRSVPYTGLNSKPLILVVQISKVLLREECRFATQVLSKVENLHSFTCTFKGRRNKFTFRIKSHEGEGTQFG